jgi:putative ABC transport system permease protein
MNSLDFAWRNVRRNRRRTILTTAALCVGCTAALMFAGYANDTVQGLQTTTVRGEGHLQVVADGYLSFGQGSPARFAVRGYQALIERIRQDPVLRPMIRVVTAQLDIEGSAGNPRLDTSTNFVGEGVITADQATMLSWDGLNTHIPPHASYLADAGANDGVIGVGLAQLLGMCSELHVSHCERMPGTADDPSGAAGLPADLARLSSTVPLQPAGAAPSIDLLAATANGVPNVVRLNVLAAERQAVRAIDAMYVGVPLSMAQRLVFGHPGTGVSAVVVLLNHTSDLATAQRRLEQLVQGNAQKLDVLSFHDVSPVYDQIVGNYTTIFSFVAVLIGIITVFSVVNTVGMAVSERTAEVGTLRALGFQRGAIRDIFVIEGALVGLIGSIAGVVAAVVIANCVVNFAGLTWTPPGRSSAIPIRVDVFADLTLLPAAVLLLTALASLSSLSPAHRASRLEITEALRHV